jgi:hypothetical protein
MDGLTSNKVMHALSDSHSKSRFLVVILSTVHTLRTIVGCCRWINSASKRYSVWFHQYSACTIALL